MKRLIGILLRIGAAIYFWLTVGCTKQIERQVLVTHETVDTVMVTPVLNYKSPVDSGLIYLVFDTVPGFQLDSIVIVDLHDSVSRSYVPEVYIESYVFHPLIPMICSINFYYEWTEPNPPTFSPIISMYTFNYDHSWTTQVGNHSPHDGIHYSVATFPLIDITKIFTIKFQNH